MNLWSEVLNGEAYKAWMDSRLSGSRISPGTRLDPFGTSMRNSKRISEWLECIESGIELEARGGNGVQNVTDLRSVGLLSSENIELSSCGQAVLDRWRELGINDDVDENEFKRSLILAAEGVLHEVSLFQSAVSFWREIREKMNFLEVVKNTESLYFLSFLNMEVDGFNPWHTTRALGLSFPASGNVSQLRGATLFGGSDEQDNIAKLDKWLSGFSTRAKPRQRFCLAMEVLTGGESSIAEILGNPDALSIIGNSSELSEISDIYNYYANKLNGADFVSGASNLIFYGPPGTGKSFEAERKIIGWESETVIFHPAFDYSSFVGYYKPVSEYNSDHNKYEVIYRYAPQAFMNLYVSAWKNLSKPHCLLIEEINRGSCAQIFGDIFQLLDRDVEGFSKYFISVDRDIELYLNSELEGTAYSDIVSKMYADRKGVQLNNPYGVMLLPSNLSIFATMNTSDQSLFPMDSAFKRRWEWKYIPIDYSYSQDTVLDIGGEKYQWVSFIKTVNRKILSITESEDKQIGNYFVNPGDGVINENLFVNKVMFYLWSDIFREEDSLDENNIFKCMSDDGATLTVAYSELFSGSDVNSEVVKSILDFNKIEKHN